MATRPTRRQQQACDQFAEALGLITEAARLDDGTGRLDADDLAAVADRLAGASSFPREEIVARAVERRGRALGLRSGTADLLSLLEGGLTPLETLLLPDEEFRALVARIEEELGPME